MGSVEIFGYIFSKSKVSGFIINANEPKDIFDEGIFQPGGIFKPDGVFREKGYTVPIAGTSFGRATATLSKVPATANSIFGVTNGVATCVGLVKGYALLRGSSNGSATVIASIIIQGLMILPDDTSVLEDDKITSTVIDDTIISTVNEEEELVFKVPETTI